MHSYCVHFFECSQKFMNQLAYGTVQEVQQGLKKMYWHALKSSKIYWPSYNRSDFLSHPQSSCFANSDSWGLYWMLYFRFLLWFFRVLAHGAILTRLVSPRYEDVYEV